MNKIILIGYMASGKTTVGKSLSNITGVTLMDTDSLIEHKYHMSINEMFKKNGEEFFRDAETKILKELLEDNRACIISTGGGMPIREENQKLLKKLGKIVYLKTDAMTTIRRTSMDFSRPLLNNNNTEEHITNMLSQRIPIYTRIADVVIDTTKNSVDTIVKEILRYADILKN